MKLINLLSDAGNNRNEDLVKFTSSYVVVLDGSTGLRSSLVKGYASDAIWLVNTALNYIERNIESYPDLKKLIVNLVEYLREEYASMGLRNIHKVQMPSSSMTMLVDKGEYVEIINIGDCTTIVETMSGKINVIHDKTVSKLDNAVIEKMKNISVQMNIPLIEAREFVFNELLKNRMKKNEVDGYSILDLQEVNVENLKVVKHKKSKLKRICMFTDGIADHYETLGLSSDIYDFYNNFVKKNSLEEILSQIRKCQEDDKFCNLYPRLKKSDDASIVNIAFT